MAPHRASPGSRGHTFLAGSDLQRFRILDVNTDDVRDEAHGVFAVEPVDYA